MNRLIISLLKGKNSDKLTLLKSGISRDEIIKLANSNELKNNLNLDKGYYFDEYNKIDDYVNKTGINLISINCSNYPILLKNIFDPPFLLYVRGNVDSLCESLVGVVGTRKASVRGLHESFKLGLDLGREGVGVCSGLALGIDAAAHKGNLATGGRTVAVLGSGIDVIYPTSNRQLAGEIILNKGAVVSEFPPGESPKPYNFPKRNRVIAGLSQDLVIIQSPLKSGSLITGDFAIENGRDVFIHSVGIGDKRYLGSDKLYRDGATKIDSAFNILQRRGLGANFKTFNSGDYTNVDLLKLELNGKLVKYRGEYFQK
ncbi:MAG: DNA-processing protein DprA [Spirochaetales bacterium]|nr:DNA-processing protein DprA [Spirochaetales bacterium]